MVDANSKHLMIDLETFSTQPGAAVVEIGLALFSERSGIIEARSIGVDVTQDQGAHFDGDTLAWWLTQEEEPRRALVSRTKLHPQEALLWVRQFMPGRTDEGSDCAWVDLEGVWGHGPTFDVSQMEAMFHRWGARAPWSHRQPRDTRTLMMALELAGIERPAYKKGGITHSAMQDAVDQANWVAEAMRRLRSHAR